MIIDADATNNNNNIIYNKTAFRDTIFIPFTSAIINKTKINYVYFVFIQIDDLLIIFLKF